MVRYKLIILVTVVFALMIAFGGFGWRRFRSHLFGGGWSYEGWGNLPFDQKQWRAARNWNPNNVRGKMVRRLLHDYQLKGMTRKEAIALLGQPDGADGSLSDSQKFSDAAINKARTLYWVLGMWSGMRMDYDTLDLEFEERGRVVNWAIVQH
jgi:hypothetical protein